MKILSVGPVFDQIIMDMPNMTGYGRMSTFLVLATNEILSWYGVEEVSVSVKEPFSHFEDQDLKNGEIRIFLKKKDLKMGLTIIGTTLRAQTYNPLSLLNPLRKAVEGVYRGESVSLSSSDLTISP